MFPDFSNRIEGSTYPPYTHEFSGETKGTILFSQIKLYGKKDGTQKTVSDSGISGKDTDPTISATYKKD
ncbi:MAG: hypothetical protein RR607_05995 [Akkermansia sp.]